MLPGDELVADYLARVGRAAAAAWAPADSAAVVEEVGRRVRAEVGAPPRWDLHRTVQRLMDLGEAEDLVAKVGRELFPDAVEGPQPEPQSEPRQSEFLSLPPTEAPTDNPTLDLGIVPRPVLPAQAAARRSETAGAGPARGPFRPLFRDEEEPPRVRPIAPDESLAREGSSMVNRLGWEFVALFVLGIAVLPFGYLGWAAGALLIARSRYWEISDKVRVLIGMPTAALGFAVLWAWLQSTQIQESDDSGTRLAEAGHTLGRAFEVIPQLCGVVGSLYLAYALVRDHHAR